MQLIVNFTHPAGLHARPTVMLAGIVKNLNAEVCIVQGNQKANLKDVLQVLSLGIGPGKVHLEATGPDANDALKLVEQAFNSNFDQYD